MMRERLFGVAKQTSKKVLALTTTSVLAFSGLALAAPMFFAGSAAAQGSSSLLINEIFPSPDLTSQNEWVEIYNSSSSDVSLSGWDLSTPNYDFSGANVTNNCGSLVPAHGYCVLTNNSQVSNQQLLSNGGNTLTLTNGSVSDSVAYGSISSSANQSYGRTTNGGNWGITGAPTEGTSNDPTGELSVCASNCDFASPFSAMAAIATGGKIFIGAGTYQDYATLSATNVTITGAGQGSTFIEAPTSLPSEGSILTISGNNADVSGLTIEGPGPGSCGSIHDGIYIKNAGGVSLHDLAVTSIADNTNSGCQNGVGIQVGRAADGSSGSATINDVTVSDYQKTGIAVDNSGSSATISDAVVTGRGAVNYVAQNGVQFSRGATGSVSGSTISGNECDDASAGCGSDGMNDVQSVGVLLYQAGDVTISGNSISANDIGIYSLENGTATISGNTLTNNRYEGLMFDQGSTTASDNTISGGNTGILVASFSGNTDNTRVALGSDNSVSGTSTTYQVVDQDSSDSVGPLVSQPSSAYVDPGFNSSSAGGHLYGYDAFTSVAQAVAAVASGGTVNINNGTYSEAINITQPISLVGQSEDGVIINQTAATTYGQGLSIVGVNNVAISNITFNVSSGAPVNYALQAYQASNLSLSNLTFNGPGKSGLNSRGSKIGGVDINSSSNVSYDNVSVKNFSKNGFSVTAKYTASDTASANLAVSGISATGNNWAGLAFYSTNSSGSVGANITGVSFGGSNTFANNGQGIFVEGDSDANYGAGNAARYGLSDASGHSVSINGATFTGNSQAVVNYQTSAFDISGNWWGNALGPDSSDYSGLVTLTSWCTLSDCSHTQSASSGTTSLPSGPISTPSVNVANNTASVTIPATNDIVATTSSSTGTVEVTIPKGTTITASDSTWNGVVQAPTVTSVDLGSSKTVALAIEVGDSNVSLTFDKAARLVLPGQAGKLAGFVRNGNFTQITDVCTADNQAAGDALASGGNCYINVGSDLVVWTKHFTTFVAYSEPSGQASSGSSSNSSASSSRVVTASAPASSTPNQTGNGAGSVQGQSTNAASGQTASTNTKATASVSEPKAAAHEAGGIRWFWWVVIAIIAFAAAAFAAYRYADGTDEA